MLIHDARQCAVMYSNGVWRSKWVVGTVLKSVFCYVAEERLLHCASENSEKKKDGEWRLCHNFLQITWEFH